MELDGPYDGSDDEPGGFGPVLPPDDRLWRHPSELRSLPPPPPPPAAPAPAPGPLRSSRPLGWGTALVSGLVGSVLTLGLVAAAGGLDGESGPDQVVVHEQVAPTFLQSDQRATGVVGIAERVRPAITRIEVSGTDGPGSGSGVLFRDDGHVLTNAHVVKGARSITVVLAGGDEVDGTLVGSDEETDIAVVKIEGDEPFPTAVLGSAMRLKVGQPAIAIGSPLGLAGGPSVTTGVVSALGRHVESQEGPPLLDMIQTDAPISPGSSGGALLDAGGSVIGITTAIAVSEVGAEGLGFATPIDIARAVADDIIMTGKAVHVWLGITGTDLDNKSADDLGVDGGARVKDVVDGSPAAAVGLESGDVVVAVDGQPVASMSQLVVALRTRDPGEQIEVTWIRDGEEQHGAAALAERPDDLDKLDD